MKELGLPQDKLLVEGEVIHIDDDYVSISWSEFWAKGGNDSGEYDIPWTWMDPTYRDNVIREHLEGVKRQHQEAIDTRNQTEKAERRRQYRLLKKEFG